MIDARLESVNVDELEFYAEQGGPCIETTHKYTREKVVDDFDRGVWHCQNPEIKVYHFGITKADWESEEGAKFLLKLYDLEICFSCWHEGSSERAEDGTHIWVIDKIGLGLFRHGPESHQGYYLAKHKKFRTKKEMEKGIAIFKKAMSTYYFRYKREYDGKTLVRTFVEKKSESSVKFTTSLEKFIKSGGVIE